jgi:CheY-like chemotaxis protein
VAGWGFGSDGHQIMSNREAIKAPIPFGHAYDRLGGCKALQQKLASALCETSLDHKPPGYLRSFEETARKLLALIHHAQGSSRLEAGILDLELLALDIAENVEQMAAAPRQGIHSRSVPILLIEDTPEVRLTIAEFLDDTPYKIDLADNGASGLQKVFTGNYQLVLMDLHMPVMNGLTATRLLRLWERETGRPPMPIVLLMNRVTRNNPKNKERMAKEAGYTTRLLKPIHKAKLLETLDSLTAELIPGPLAATAGHQSESDGPVESPR